MFDPNSPLGALIRQAEQDNAATAAAANSTPKPLTHSVVFDAVSVARALFEFMEYAAAKFGAPEITFDGTTADQVAFLQYMRSHSDAIQAATGLTSLASDDNTVLNSFLAANGSNRTIEPFDGIGVVTIYRLLVEWANKAKVGTLRYRGDNYAAFTVAPRDVQIYTLDTVGSSTYERFVLKLSTKTGHKVCISELPPDLAPPTSAMDVLRTVDMLSQAPRQIAHYHVNGAKVPMIRFNTKTDLDWLKGINAAYPGDHLTITSATQDWKVDINDVGAKVEVITTVVMARGGSGDEPFTVDQPVFVWVTAPGSNLPQAVMYCHPADTWIPVP